MSLAKARMRAKIKLLQEAFAWLPAGGFAEHRRFLLQRMLGRVATRGDTDAEDRQLENAPTRPLTTGPPKRRTVLRP